MSIAWISTQAEALLLLTQVALSASSASISLHKNTQTHIFYLLASLTPSEWKYEPVLADCISKILQGLPHAGALLQRTWERLLWKGHSPHMATAASHMNHLKPKNKGSVLHRRY